MSRGQNTQNGKLFFLSVKGLKEGEKVYIKQVEAKGKKDNGDNILVDHPNVNDVGGQVHKIETVMREWEGVVKPSIVIWLKDLQADEMVRLQCGMNKIGRSIINSLASIEGNLGNVSISVYNSKKPNKYGKTGGAAVSVAHNGQKIGWKYSADEQKKYVKVGSTRVRGTDGKMIDKETFDNLELDEFFLNIWNTEIKNKVQTITSPSDSSFPAPAATEGPKDDTDATGDDLPF